DVEFAIDTDGEVYLLQARPITIDPGETAVDDRDLYQAIDNAKRDFESEQPPSPSVLGDRTIYGVMPDWNPAEIIGRQPGLLAESLYRYLIMDDTWARQRAEFGYIDVRPQPLMKCFAGQPYVDVRAVFNSFVPDGVSEDLAEKLVRYYLDRLEENPHLHDKIEFEIAITCLPFDFEYRAEPLREAGFTDEELADLKGALREITIGAFERVESGRDLDQVDRLEARYEELREMDISHLRTIRYLLDDCLRLGTLPFAHLARAGFVAVSLLRSLERIGVLSEDDVSRFLNSMNTVAREFEHDGYRVATGNLKWEEYVEIYGHLRPGTYDITSPAYAQDPEGYLRPMVETAIEPEDHPDPAKVWDESTKDAVESELGNIGLPRDVDRFVEFLRESIEGREYSKFVFSKNLSHALEELAEFGEAQGLSREELAHVSINDVFELLANHPPESPGKWLQKRSKEGRERHLVTEAVELPPLLFSPEDFDSFERPSREPNFVTTETVRKSLIEAAGDSDPELNDAIVMIPQADPGYDWLFGYDIAGLITMYGGANSHMAIRSAEFGIPAAIGVGEDKYQQLQGADMLELDCASRTIERIK
ncbi:MAG: PEP-utilizing enzyme, partial [archaeon]